ncbi:hypothetical protein PLESTB_001159600 [Pleodorina starrii]|uniref:BP28 C-terminal domain-containing protein n=1 Tax=Pleodorina starrii TaxID=330485 RepID=A0A9W6BR74_9CHLO|nr:hypothetical protein PLESTM_000236200 [Pleodorina starrii]GLC56884.1 hypothetical protein PLESTB_001159600 [Pleodorina starrii]GLC64722.1 hypothetical protein PLESTF_000200400 [Pleodorina starrii]
MASLLASQLQTLARQRQPTLPAAVKKGKPSLLFDFQKAADVDLQTIYDVACQGLEDLTRLEPRFRPYRESLFSRASLDINPELQTPEFLSKLSESIYSFCCLLSNHFLSPPAFKALEYLIRRYKANERNVDALMTAALPYHSTNEFVRLVQTLALGAPGSLWGWLAKMQTSGASLPRDLLAQRCINDRQLLIFICKAAGQLGGASQGAPAPRPPSRTYLSFYAVLLCEVLAVLPVVNEDFLAALLPFLIEGLGRGAAQDYRAATLMAVAELFSRATLGKDFIKVMLNSMLKHTEPVPEHIRTTFLVMAHMAVTQQHIRSLSEKTLKYMMALPNAVSELAALSQRGNIRMGPLLQLIVRSLAVSLSGGTGGRCESDLLSLAHSGALRGELARDLASSLLEKGGSASADEAVREGCQRVLRVLDQRYPETTDAAVNAFLEPLRVQRQQQRQGTTADAADPKAKSKRRKTHHKADGKAAASAPDDEDEDMVAETAEAASAGLDPEDRVRFDFVRSTFATGGYSAPCGGTMLTLAAALTAPQAAVRRMALQQLDADLAAVNGPSAPAAAAGEPGDAAAADDSATASAASEARTALTAAALSRLRDDDLGVVVAALGLSCLKELPPSALLDALAPLANRVGEFLYGVNKSQLKWARKAARKVVMLLRHIGSSSAASSELRQAAALHLLALMPPSPRDPRVAVEAARAAAELALPLFSELEAVAGAIEAQLKKMDDNAKEAARIKKAAAKAKGDGSEKPAVATEQDAGETHISKKAAQKAAVVAVERGLVSALAKALAVDPASSSADVKQLVAASAAAAVTGGDAAEAASRRVQHLLLLASHAASASATSTVGKAPSAAEVQLLRSVVGLAEVLLPYARLGASGDAAADGGWRAAFAEQVSPEDGLPTEGHVAALMADAVSAHAALILGALHASLTRLPEPSEVAVADTQPAVATTAQRVLGVLSTLGYSAAGLGDLPALVVTRAVKPSARSAFLSDIYAAPAAQSTSAAPSSSSSPSSAPLQCLALHVQAQLAGANSACSWLVSLLPALANSEAAVRSAACDCLAVVGPLLAAVKPSAAVGSSSPSAAVPSLSAHVASQLCSALLAQRKLVCRDPQAVSALLHATAAPAKKGGVAEVSLSTAAAAELTAYLTSSLRGLGVTAAGVNTACLVLACVGSAATSPAASTVGKELFGAGCEYLSRLVSRLRERPASATALDARAVELLITSLFTPASVAAAAAAHDETSLGRLAEATELLPTAFGVEVPAAPAVAALAAARLAAVRQVSREIFAALPADGRTVRELFAVLLTRHVCDADEEVRAAARTALETVPLAAEIMVPLLDPPAAAADAAAVAADAPRAKKKSKKSEAAVLDAMPVVTDPAAAPPSLAPAALRDAVAVLELLQWRTGISSPHLLVAACQSLMRRLLPIVGSIASVLEAEDVAEAAEAAATAGAKSSLAGYASTLALQALAGLARDGDGGDGDVAMEEEAQPQPQFDLELAVRTAREAPDAAVRNAALDLLAALATRMPEAALSHVLQVLAVVNQSAALQDDEHSRAIGATALAAVVPAWVGAGRRPAALWEQVVSSLPSLPGHRRLEVLLALMRALPEVEEGLSDGLLVLLQHTADPKPLKPAASTPKPAAEATANGGGGKTPKSAKKAKQQQAEAAKVVTEQPENAEPPPSKWLPELASQMALQVELSVRLASCARVMEMALAASGHQAHTALPRTVVAFVTTQLKLKVAVAAASASRRRPEPNPALDLGCRRLMEAALAQMQLLQPKSATPAPASAAASTTPPHSRQAASHRAVLSASRALYGLFAALQGVMAADTYLQSLLTLAEHPADKVKRRALKLFTDKVRGVRSEIEDQIELPQRVRNAKLRQAGNAAARACAMLPPLLSASSDASPLTRQLALVALSAIAVEFGPQQHAALLAGVPVVLAATKDSHASIRASALATVASFVRALEAKLVPVLPATVAAAVAAADSAWARLARAGGGADAEMPEAGADEGDAADSDSGQEEDDSSDGEGGGVRARRRAGRGGRRDAEDAALELSSALACLHALVETLGGFLSPHLSSVLAILLNPRVLACTTAGCDKFAASIRAKLPTAVPPRLLLPALYERLEPCIAAAADAPATAADGSAAAAAAPAVALLQMFAATAAALEAKVAAQYCDGMFAFLLRALDIRQRRPPALAAHGDSAIDVVEAAAISALVALVMKLSEARFKPLFLRLLEWASTVTVPEVPGARGEPTYLGRMVALFGAVNALTDRLRSVLVPYYRYLLDLSVQHLAGDDEGLGGKLGRGKPSKKARRSLATAEAAAADSTSDVAAYHDQKLCLAWLLRLRVVRALHRCFMHDSVGFVDPDRFARLQPALVSQLAAEPPNVAVSFLLSSHHADPELSSYVSLGRSTRVYTAPDGSSSLGPLGGAAVGCLLAMAVAANSDALWKPLNHATLMLTRSPAARTRALGLEVVAQLVDRLREEYLVLLPEALPFLSELLEDDDAVVAARVREVVAQLEDISGEKLDEYLKV